MCPHKKAQFYYFDRAIKTNWCQHIYLGGTVEIYSAQFPPDTNKLVSPLSATAPSRVENLSCRKQHCGDSSASQRWATAIFFWRAALCLQSCHAHHRRSLSHWWWTYKQRPMWEWPSVVEKLWDITGLGFRVSTYWWGILLKGNSGLNVPDLYTIWMIVDWLGPNVTGKKAL